MTARHDVPPARHGGALAAKVSSLLHGQRLPGAPCRSLPRVVMRRNTPQCCPEAALAQTACRVMHRSIAPSWTMRAVAWPRGRREAVRITSAGQACGRPAKFDGTPAR